MAIIYRQRLTGEALKIKNEALKQAQSDPLLGGQIVALNQQKAILDAQQQGLISSVGNTLQQVSNNIYQAQRQAKANSAALGYIGDISALRDQSDLQLQVSNEYAAIINEAEQGAISIAGQQTAINKAEVQLAQDAILNEYVDTLIDENRTDIIDRDYNREASYIAGQVFMGAFSGLAAGLGLSFGVKGLFNPQSKLFKKLISGGMVVGTLGFGLNSILDAAGVETNAGWAIGGSVGVGAALGVGSHIFGLGNNLGKNLGNRVYGNLGLRPAKQYTAQQWVEHAYDWELGSHLKPSRGPSLGARMMQTKAGGRVANIFNRTLGRITPWTWALAGVGAVIGSIVGGVNASKTKFYKINYDNLLKEDAAKQFMDFGLDLEGIVDIVYNRRN